MDALNRKVESSHLERRHEDKQINMPADGEHHLQISLGKEELPPPTCID